MKTLLLWLQRHKTLIPVRRDTYQNGAYWGTASGWIAYALHEQHWDQTERLYQELIANYQKNGIYECIHKNYKKSKNYVTSVVNPFGA